MSKTQLVHGDHLRLLQVLSNLVGNATKYSDQGTVVSVVSIINADHIEISVVDQGRGLNDVDKERAFEMFYRGSSRSTRQESGTGIGLAVSKFIVEAHKGSIAIEDADPAGIRVIINLPLALPTVENNPSNAARRLTNSHRHHGTTRNEHVG